MRENDVVGAAVLRIWRRGLVRYYGYTEFSHKVLCGLARAIGIGGRIGAQNGSIHVAKALGIYMAEKDLTARFIIVFMDRPDFLDYGLGKTSGIAIEQYNRHVGAFMWMQPQIPPNEVENTSASFRRAVISFVIAFGCKNRWFVQAVVLNDITQGQ